MNQIFRDTTYDNKSPLWKLRFGIGLCLCAIGPMLFSSIILSWMYYSGRGEIGSRSFSMTGTVLLLGALFLTVILLMWFMRRFDFTNRYHMIIKNEHNELFYADMTSGALLGYYTRQIPDYEKRAYRPKGMHLFFNVLAPLANQRYRGSRDMSTIRDMELFRYNQAHPFVEPLLTGELYTFYCEKILRTEKIREKHDRAEVVLITQSGDQTAKKTVRFYRSMPEYEYVLQMLRKRDNL